ncbi:hypothetical protein C8J57DRAFT_1482098 [Mycena rebaudengoi]|nr:hypothetical protein C8J57DRAFT_1482098 [Mycena rebaudengoi]
MSTAELRTRRDNLYVAIAQQRAVVLEQQAKLGKLSMSRQTVQSHLDSLTYPVLTLPVEITSQIFIYCLPSPPHDEACASRAPLLLRFVCKSWRDIALSTSALWATLNFDTERLSPAFSTLELVESVLKTWTDRALTLRGELLEILGSEPLTELIRRMAPQLQAFGMHVELEGICGLDTEFNLNLQSKPLHFPLLRKLLVGFWDCSDANDLLNTDLPQHAFTDLPLLREVHFVSWARPLLVYMPWGQLTEYTGELLTFEEVWYLLTEAVNLVECTLSITTEDVDDFDPPNPFSHQQLRSLSLIEDLEDEDPGCQTDSSYPSCSSRAPPRWCDEPQYRALFLHCSKFRSTAQVLGDPGKQFLPLIQHVSFLNCDIDGLLEKPNIELLASALASYQNRYSLDGFAGIRSFKLCIEPEDEIEVEDLTGLLAGVAASGLDIYVGTKAINYLAQRSQ